MGESNQKIGANEIVRLKYEKGSLKYEDGTDKDFSPDNFDTEIYEMYKKNV